MSLISFICIPISCFLSNSEKTFPVSSPLTTATVNVEKKRRLTLPCECASQTPGTGFSVAYWSTGEGISTDTDIVGARFADGTVLQIQYGADYSISADLSLIINSFNNGQDVQRFWCHVFKSNDELSSCYTDVQMIGTET